MSYTKSKSILSAANSNLTSPPIYVGDAFDITFSRQTSTTSAANLTIQGTNADGFGNGAEAVDLTKNSSNTLWSTITTNTAAGLYSVTPGFAWIRAIRTNIGVSAASNETVNLNWLVRSW